VQRRAARAGRDPGLAQVDERALLAERALDGAQLGVHRAERGELLLHERGPSRPKRCRSKVRPAEVAVPELAHAAQVAQPPAQLAPVAEAGRHGDRRSRSPAAGSTAGRTAVG
jgi:hypothetical protein